MGKLRQNEMVRRMTAAQRWEQERRAASEAVADPRPAAAVPPPTAAPALAPVPAGRAVL
jgi:hypothetical protein